MDRERMIQRARILLNGYIGEADGLPLRRYLSEAQEGYIPGIMLTTPDEFASSGKAVKIVENAEDEIRLLKQITRQYIISQTPLAAQQVGQRKIITDLFLLFFEDLQSGQPKYIPKRFHHLTEDKTAGITRKVADCVSSLSEAEAYGLHGRLMGYNTGSVLDPIVR